MQVDESAHGCLSLIGVYVCKASFEGKISGYLITLVTVLVVLSSVIEVYHADVESHLPPLIPNPRGLS